MTCPSLLCFSTRAYQRLTGEMVALGGFEAGRLEVKHFPDGERYTRILDSVTGRDVVLVGGTISDTDTLELYDLACSVVKYGARSLRLVIPYFGYSTMERAVKSGEIVMAKTRARLLSSIPEASVGNRVILLDLHSEGIPHYFEGGVRPVHLYARDLILDAARRHGGDRFVMACTDAGRAKWVESLANWLGVSASFVFKRRLSGEHTEISAVSAHVEDQTVVIYDDMIRTGGSLINAAKAYRDSGARDIVALATHGLLPGDALKRIADTGLFKAIAVTDSHPRVHEIDHSCLERLSIAPLLSQFLMADHKGLDVGHA